MNEDAFRFLSLSGRLPLRLDVQQVAWLLNCEKHDIPVLVAARLLKPLGKPPPNSRKFFSTARVLERSSDDSWLDKMSDAIHTGWKNKNGARRHFKKAAIAAERKSMVPPNLFNEKQDASRVLVPEPVRIPNGFGMPDCVDR